MPKPLDEWLWKAMRDWQMPGRAQLRYGVWHRGEVEGFADCGVWLGASWVSADAGKDAAYRNPFSNKPLRNGELCVRCFAEELPVVQAVWESLFGPAKGFTPPKRSDPEWVRF